MQRGKVLNIWNNGKYLLEPEGGGKYIAITGCPPWFRKGDTVSYKVTDENSQKSYSLGEYVRDTKYGRVINKDNRGYIVRPRLSGKFIKVRRPQPWIEVNDMIPFEITNLRPDKSTNEGILADRSIEGSIVAIAFFGNEELSDSAQDGINYCCMSTGGSLYDRVIDKIRHCYFQREDMEEPMLLRKDKKESGFKYRCGWHEDPDFLRTVLAKFLENFDVNNGRIRRENRLIHLEELFLDDPLVKEIRAARQKRLQVICDILKINCIDIMKERLLN
ncbi:hypothetical protein KY335_02885 [Candidatus Woesearchaeota archaeon]|nr:hypothetical protein [Candidatus Woesearchaeota archaeon]